MFEPAASTENPERRLWGAVLNLAITDALWPTPLRTSKETSTRTSELEQYQTRQWFGSRDFRLVCSLAGVEPEFVYDRITPLFEDAEAGRQFLLGLGGAHRRSADPSKRTAA